MSDNNIPMMKTKTFVFENDMILILIAALYVLEERMEKGNMVGQRADNVFMIDGYGYPELDEVVDLRDFINEYPYDAPES